MRQWLFPVGLLLILLVSACDTASDHGGVGLEVAVEGEWHEAWSQHISGLIVVIDVCGPLPGDPCTADQPELIESATTLELRDGAFVASTRSHYFVDANDTSDTLRTSFARSEGRYEVTGDTLVLVSEEETERYVTEVAGDSLRLRDVEACDIAVEGFCALTPGEVGLPWAAAPGFLKVSGTFGRD